MKKLITWFDAHILSVLTIIFLFLIPLYPKFPLIDIHDTYISIRFEDFFTVLMFGVFLLQLVRRKITLERSYLIVFALFWGTVFLSYFWGLFIGKTIPFAQIGFLHAGRRVQYMLPFLISYAAVTHELRQSGSLKTALRPFFTTMTVVIIIVCLYAVGQKSAAAFQPARDAIESVYMSTSNPIVKNVSYFAFRFLDFPAVQTMNSEFAKGHLLNLTPESRVSSTFAGHYDLAAFIVFFLPFLAGSIIMKHHRVWNWVAYVLSIFTLILTASRASFGAMGVSLPLYFLYTRKWKMLLLTIFITGSLMFVNKDMTDRFKDMFQKKRVFQNIQTGDVIIDQDLAVEQLPAGSQFISEGKTTKVQMNKKDTQNLKEQLVKKELEDAKKSGKEITEAQARIQVDKKYEELASFIAKDVIAGDTSLATRTQIEWPRAINAFLSNPLFGTGVSSITESTDGDYFRWIGEMGALGSGLFIYILLFLGFSVWQMSRMESTLRPLSLAFVAGLIALAGNAVLIDVFEASKVAFVFWTAAGIWLAASDYARRKVSPNTL